jgi:hypothetical protein
VLVLPVTACKKARRDVMALPDGPIELELDDGAKNAVAAIMQFLGEGVQPEEAIERALGTELYLLRQVRAGGHVFVEKNGERLAIDLLNK